MSLSEKESGAAQVVQATPTPQAKRDDEDVDLLIRIKKGNFYVKSEGAATGFLVVFVLFFMFGSGFILDSKKSPALSRALRNKIKANPEKEVAIFIQGVNATMSKLVKELEEVHELLKTLQKKQGKV